MIEQGITTRSLLVALSILVHPARSPPLELRPALRVQLAPTRSDPGQPFVSAVWNRCRLVRPLALKLILFQQVFL